MAYWPVYVINRSFLLSLPYCTCNMDDLLALFDEIPPGEAAETVVNPSSETTQDHEGPSNTVETQNYQPEQNKKHKKHSPLDEERRLASISSNVDARVGFRITHRTISSMDLLDMLSNSPFHTAASLAAMNLKQLNTLLVDPARVIDKATVAGRTSLITAGIVLSNTGTRIASSGSAFTILTVGTLRAGACISVMLFGTVYGKFCRKLVPGKVISITCPRLVPPKDGYSGETTVTFSLNEDRQILILGTATDFGICKGTVRGKNDRGVWVENAKKCRNFVDASICQYCKAHVGQANKKATAAQSRMQSLRDQGRIRAVETSESFRNGRVISMPKNATSSFARNAASGSLAHQVRQISPGTLLSRTSIAPIHGKPANNRLLNPPQTQILQNGKGVPRNFNAKASLVPPKVSMRNPYACQADANGSKLKPVVTPAMTRHAQTQKVKQPVQLRSLIASGKRSCNEPSKMSLCKKKARTVNTDVAGFDGSVAVPRPKGRMASSNTSQCPQLLLQPQRQGKSADEIREQQRAMAEKLRSQPKENNIPGYAKGRATDNKEFIPLVADGWCVPLNDAERERLRHVKSVFSTEADAEMFVTSRRVITELEKAEERKTKSKNKKTASQENKSIHTTWQCHTCQQTTPYRPVRCYTSHHDVRVVRDLRENTSREKKRTELSNRKTADGGLKLGSGLEWSWSRFS